MRPSSSAAGSENDGKNDPPGAGAASGRNGEMPRAQSRRGERKSRSAKFYAQLTQMRPAAKHRDGADATERWSAARISAVGEFIGSARWITTPSTRPARDEHFAPTRPIPVEAVGPDEASAEPLAPDTELGALLDAIAEDVQHTAAAVRAGIMADFAARVAHARRHLPRQQLAAALRGFAEARKAALALARRNARMELQARKKAAILMRQQSRPRPGKRGRKLLAYTPKRH
jgi:hypothetical protein